MEPGEKRHSSQDSGKKSDASPNVKRTQSSREKTLETQQASGKNKSSAEQVDTDNRDSGPSRQELDEFEYDEDWEHEYEDDADDANVRSEYPQQHGWKPMRGGYRGRSQYSWVSKSYATRGRGGYDSRKLNHNFSGSRTDDLQEKEDGSQSPIKLPNLQVRLQNGRRFAQPDGRPLVISDRPDTRFSSSDRRSREATSPPGRYSKRPRLDGDGVSNGRLDDGDFREEYHHDRGSRVEEETGRRPSRHLSLNRTLDCRELLISKKLERAHDVKGDLREKIRRQESREKPPAYDAGSRRSSNFDREDRNETPYRKSGNWEDSSFTRRSSNPPGRREEYFDFSRKSGREHDRPGRDNSVDRARDRARERAREREMERDAEREREREAEREREREAERNREREERQKKLERELIREREIVRESKRELERERERLEKKQELEKQKEAERRREMEQRDLERREIERKRELEREREKLERQQERDRQRALEMQRELERQRLVEREMERQRDVERKRGREMEREPKTYELKDKERRLAREPDRGRRESGRSQNDDAGRMREMERDRDEERRERDKVRKKERMIEERNLMRDRDREREAKERELVRERMGRRERPADQDWREKREPPRDLKPTSTMAPRSDPRSRSPRRALGGKPEEDWQRNRFTEPVRENSDRRRHPGGAPAPPEPWKNGKPPTVKEWTNALTPADARDPRFHGISPNVATMPAAGKPHPLNPIGGGMSSGIAPSIKEPPKWTADSGPPSQGAEGDFWHRRTAVEHRDYKDRAIEAYGAREIPLQITDEPNEVIFILGLPPDVAEFEIRRDIRDCDLWPSDVRLLVDATGKSQGVMVVTFNSKDEAYSWMSFRKGKLALKNGSFAPMIYKSSSYDWMCVRCDVPNYKNNSTCCCCKRIREECLDGYEEASPYPTNALVLRNVNPKTSQATVISTLKCYLQNLRLERLQIGPRCLCFLELTSVVDALALYTRLLGNALMIEKRQVVVSYARLERLPQMQDLRHEPQPAPFNHAPFMNSFGSSMYGGQQRPPMHVMNSSNPLEGRPIIERGPLPDPRSIVEHSPALRRPPMHSGGL